MENKAWLVTKYSLQNGCEDESPAAHYFPVSGSHRLNHFVEGRIDAFPGVAIEE